MAKEPVYIEQVSSNRTEALFVALAVLFFVLFASIARGTVSGVWRVVCFLLFVMFVFYALNYRTLIIRISEEALELQFGIFRWDVPFENITTSFIDPTSLWRIGGAGIHFTWLGGRYRAMFNFLEHPRVVVMLKKKQGVVRDIAFSTQRPEQVMRLIRPAGWGNGSQGSQRPV